MRELRIHSWCDACKAADVDTEAIDFIAFALDGRPMRYDYCADRGHADPLWSQLTALATEDLEATAPRPKNGKQWMRKPEPPRPCPVCGVVMRSGGGMAAHMAAKHPDVEVSGAPVVVSEPPWICPECSREFSRSQALGNHRAQTHGVKR